MRLDVTNTTGGEVDLVDCIRVRIPHHKILNVLMHLFHAEHMSWTVRGSDGRVVHITGGSKDYRDKTQP